MSDEVQLHVDVPRELWKAMKQVALDSGGTLKGVALDALEKRFGGVTVGRKEVSKASELPEDNEVRVQPPKTVVKPMEKVSIIPLAEPIRDKCGRCGDTVLVSEIMREPRTGRKLCPDCVENIKNGQA